MATATSTPPSATSTAAASSGQGTDDNYAPAGQSADGGTDPQGDTTPGESAAPPATPAAAAADPGSDDSRSSDPLKAERRKNNQLEKEIRTLRQPAEPLLGDQPRGILPPPEPDAAPAEATTGEVVAGDNSGADDAAPEADTVSDEPAAA